mmetsp:Transcript_17545/g.25970  ORF Transcript_17545/g.25970 Transcript_17545/m.25970 type:complete len:434 (-) Transcript_17545:116-1417(-)|eukprot:CAMPEP_0194219146 /NCGR_PEP_ID=MMETSP0156-20130528/25299_1 /TAXON_ID=33649 /ORGANISM="Thalassionema nitzschioides, Strain L26-B" /LENGTH=433 /DNA_ID=CAMNT_0038948713 /DNA_START=85 /DNA_END=1389 /DNA_ORIENTATION=-
MENRMRAQLLERKEKGRLRTRLPVTALENSSSLFDFSSNDYLGLAQSDVQKNKVDQIYQSQGQKQNLGATGSRLLSGDSPYARHLEVWLSRIHNRSTATLFNSGYDANISLLSSIVLSEDWVLVDELCHNSLIMGVRMSRRRQYVSFAHNNVADLQYKLENMPPLHAGQCLIVVESVYSMDGDVAPLATILDLATKFGAKVVVDEAHGLAIFGRSNKQDLLDSTTSLKESEQNIAPYKKSCKYGGTGVLAAMELENHTGLLASVHTFGKGAGCHGAVVCGSSVLRDYLWNYARPFVYSTALPLHSLVAIRTSYETIIGAEGEHLRKNVFSLVHLFRDILSKSLSSTKIKLCSSPSPIQALIVPGNDLCINLCQIIFDRYHILLYPIRAPTVPVGQERVRIILHAHNTPCQVRYLCQALLAVLKEMHLIMKARL